MSSSIDHWAFPLRLIAATALLGVINAVLLPWETSVALMNEGGPIEIATVVFYWAPRKTYILKKSTFE